MIPQTPADDPALSAALAVRVAAVRQLLHEIVTEFPSAAFASSLGAEDMVLTDLIIRDGLPIDIFSLDTGRLPPETYDLIAAVQRHYGRILTLYSPRHEQLEAYVRQHGINAFYDSIERRKECCQVRKIEPLQRALAGRKAWITGLRAQQSATRDGLPIRSFDAANGESGLEKFNPLAEWNEREVWAYLRLNQVPYNALHDRFYPSIGCAPCTRAITPGEDVRAGRWWWENPDSKECGLHIKRA
ncbi:MAG TPA: phosphoadenylyl-sulfate reductase [Accumulibacter sp.]|nr:phosphoadenylyl-sulfate reductase [Accumulibacter sp.]HMW17328.1 phosphoadenylyl-sulfate reductase [Accumulibacter sp.]HMX23399.1 phosphoadenylyl-sulfate reductase [Accumulibacter sp.]HNC17499.1 phosphoadenylyl-sulfate reductase [Accumulibacter sp.]HND80075.1 phosphoadenylyl-sulfate reductase [Accumulibacter sp.]